MTRTRTNAVRPHYPHGCRHPAFERGSWSVQRAAWLGMAAVVLAALLGAFGRGPLSRRERATPDRSLVVRFDRVARAGAVTRLELEFDHADQADAVVWLSNTYMEQMELDRSAPMARVEAVHTGRVAFHYPADGRARVELVFRPRAAGTVSGEFSLGPDPGEGRTVLVEHLILP